MSAQPLNASSAKGNATTAKKNSNAAKENSIISKGNATTEGQALAKAAATRCGGKKGIALLHVDCILTDTFSDHKDLVDAEEQTFTTAEKGITFTLNRTILLTRLFC